MQKLAAQFGRLARTQGWVGWWAILAVSLHSSALAQPVRPNPPLPRVALTAGIHKISAEVADSAVARQTGLMMRQALGQNEGMLFVFDHPGHHCFWMKNTLLPLTIAFIADDGTVVNLADMRPHSELSRCPQQPVRFALEMEQGWFERKGVSAGDPIGGLPGGKRASGEVER